MINNTTTIEFFLPHGNGPLPAASELLGKEIVHVILDFVKVAGCEDRINFYPTYELGTHMGKTGLYRTTLNSYDNGKAMRCRVELDLTEGTYQIVNQPHPLFPNDLVAGAQLRVTYAN
jgi:hypothetical protein